MIYGGENKYENGENVIVLNVKYVKALRLNIPVRCNEREEKCKNLARELNSFFIEEKPMRELSLPIKFKSFMPTSGELCDRCKVRRALAETKLEEFR